MNIKPIACQVLPQTVGIQSWLILLLAAACGLIATNIYYAQPLIGLINTSLGLSSQAAGMIATMPQVGYGIGLLLVVPLGDIIENRRFSVAVLCIATLASIAAATAEHAATFLAAGLFIVLGSVAVQILILYAANLTPAAAQGRVVGNVTSGLMLGIMLARPAACFITNASSWRVVFIISAIVMAMLTIVLGFTLPLRRPVRGLDYGSLVASMVPLIRHTPTLRRRAFYQTCLFGAFSLFWTTVPLLLADKFHFSQMGIALFALAGAASVFVAPIAGRVADSGWDRPATGFAMVAVAACFLLDMPGLPETNGGLAILVLAAILLGLGVTGHAVLGQRAIFSLDASSRGRLNGIFMATYFAGGAADSVLGTWSYAHGGWD
ncbi:MAG: MFS transporter [Formivibrio sp.]|nr:MFS transporter [Formivibrio sp.]